MTDRGAPLGKAVGNGLDTREALRCLAGDGPDDLADLSTVLVGEMLFLGDLAPTPEEGVHTAREALSSGRGIGRMTRLVELQGGDPSMVENPSRIPGAPEVAVLESDSSGFVGVISPTALGYGVVELGGGRRRMGDPVDLSVGFNLSVSLGDWVEPGDPIGEVHARNAQGLERGLKILRQAVVLLPEAPVASSSLVRHRLSGSE